MTIVHNLHPLIPREELITVKTIRETAGIEKIKTEISKPARLRQGNKAFLHKLNLGLNFFKFLFFSFNHFCRSFADKIVITQPLVALVHESIAVLTLHRWVITL